MLPYPNPGDHVRANRDGYWHHGIYAGNWTVLHFTGVDAKNKGGACIRHTFWNDFVKGSERVEVVNHGAPAYEPTEVVRRAFSRLGQTGYDLVFNNCEHFATWCKTGRAESQQVQATVALVALAVVVVCAGRAA
jgi:hypothetical protein